MSSRLILLSKGTAFMRGLLAKFWGQSPPALFASTEAEAFAAFLSGVDCDVPYLREVLEFDRGSLHARLTGEPVGVEFQCSPTALFDALTAGHLPGPLPLENFHVHITSAETFFTPGKLGEEKPTRFECSMPRPKKEVADELICQGRA
jgi:hypothetical protein